MKKHTKQYLWRLWTYKSLKRTACWSDILIFSDWRELDTLKEESTLSCLETKVRQIRMLFFMTPKLAPQIVSPCDRAVKVMWLRIELKFAEEHLKQRQKRQTFSQSLAPSFPGPSPFGFGVGEWLCLLREGLVYFLVSVKYWGEKYFNIMPKYTGSNFFCGNCRKVNILQTQKAILQFFFTNMENGSHHTQQNADRTWKY